MRLDRSIAYGSRVYVAGLDYEVDAATEAAITARLAAIDAAAPFPAVVTLAPAAPGVPQPRHSGAGDDLDTLGLDAGLADLLRDAGLATVSAVTDATDDALLALDGIGPASVRKIRDALTQAGGE